MGTNSAPQLVVLFLYAYDAEFIQGFLKNKDRKLTQTFNSSFLYVYDVMSLNNSRFGDYLYRIYPNELEVSDTNDIEKYASHLEIDSGAWLKTKLYDKHDDCTFLVVNVPFICGNIPVSPAFGVYISQLICYSRAVAQYCVYLDHDQLLTKDVLKQVYVAPRLKSSFHFFPVVIRK